MGEDGEDRCFVLGLRRKRREGGERHRSDCVYVNAHAILCTLDRRGARAQTFPATDTEPTTTLDRRRFLQLTAAGVVATLTDTGCRGTSEDARALTDPARVDARRLLIGCYARLGKKADVQAEWEKYQAFRPPDVEEVRKLIQEGR